MMIIFGNALALIWAVKIKKGSDIYKQNITSSIRRKRLVRTMEMSLLNL